MPDTKSLPKVDPWGGFLFGVGNTNKTPYPLCAGTSPSGGSEPKDRLGALLSFFRFPREGGDPEPYTEAKGPAETQGRQAKFAFVQFGAVRERADLVV